MFGDQDDGDRMGLRLLDCSGKKGDLCGACPWSTQIGSELDDTELSRSGHTDCDQCEFPELEDTDSKQYEFNRSEDEDGANDEYDWSEERDPEPSDDSRPRQTRIVRPAVD